MKRFRNLGTLAGALAVICLITVLVGSMEHKKEEIRNTDEVILSIPADSVVGLSWNTDTDPEGFAFTREEGGWSYEEDPEFPVDEDRIAALLSPFEALGAAFIIENVEDFGQYGLEEPVCTIRLETEEDEHVVTLGNFSAMDGQRYVSTGDGNVYLVQRDLRNDFDLKLSDLIRHDNTPGFDQVQSVTFSGRQDYELVYQEDGPTEREDDVYFARLYGELQPLDPMLVEAYLDTISWLDPKTYKTYKAAEEDLVQYGLDRPELTVTVDYTETDEDDNETAETFVLHVSRDPEQAAQAAEAADTAEEEEDLEELVAYVRIGDSRIVYQIGGEDYEALMACGYDDLRHREILPVAYTSIQRMDIELEGETYTLTAQGLDDQDKPRFFYQDEELDMSDIEYALDGLRADRFTDQAPSDKEELSLTLYLEEDAEEGIRVTLYREDGVTCLAQVDGGSVAYVPRAQAVELVEAIRAAVLPPAEAV